MSDQDDLNERYAVIISRLESELESRTRVIVRAGSVLKFEAHLGGNAGDLILTIRGPKGDKWEHPSE